MSNRLENQDRSDVIHSVLVLLVLAIAFVSYYIEREGKQNEIEKRALQTKVTPEENKKIEYIIFGESQE